VVFVLNVLSVIIGFQCAVVLLLLLFIIIIIIIIIITTAVVIVTKNSSCVDESSVHSIHRTRFELNKIRLELKIRFVPLRRFTP
jgi:hypothetical protein